MFPDWGDVFKLSGRSSDLKYDGSSNHIEFAAYCVVGGSALDRGCKGVGHTVIDKFSSLESKRK